MCRLMALERVATGDDPRLDPYRDLTARDAPHRDGLFVVETRAVVRQLLQGGRWEVRSLLLTEPALGALDDVLAARPALPVYLAPLRVVKDVVGFDFHRGCLALAERGRPSEPRELLEGGAGRLIALEGVSNPDNVGGLLRVARALGADALLCSPGCGDPLSRKAVRVSMGAALTLPWARAAAWDTALGQLRGAGFTLVALSPAGTVDVAALGDRARGRVVLVLGTEGTGLAPATVAAADVAARIPIAGGVDSLNVATACAIALDRLGWARMPSAARHPVAGERRHR